MVGLKKLLSPEKSLLHLRSPEPADIDIYELHSGECSGETAFWGYQNGLYSPFLSNMENQSFFKIERQFEELHDYFRSRPEKRYNYIDPKPCPLRTKRHVDVLEAIFSRSGSSAPVSPLTLYNEDIAERNLNSPPPIQVQDPYARVISALYQEDVADRNIAKSAGLSPHHDSDYNLHIRNTKPDVPQSTENRARTRSQSPMANRRHVYENGEGGLRTSISEHDLRNHPSVTRDKDESYHHDDEDIHRGSFDGLGDELTDATSTVSSDAGSRGTLDYLSPSDLRPAESTLGSLVNAQRVPMEHKSSQAGQSSKTNTEKGTVGKTVSRARCNLSLFPKPRTFSSRKNVYDLSINMELAAPRKMFVKMGTRPPESAPVPVRERNPSIAEIVNSPVSVSSMAPTIPKPPSYGMEEMMNLFKQAYNSIQPKTSHPTFETLQDAIVREINSHDAFRQVHSASISPHEHSPVLIMEYPQEPAPGHVTNRPSGTNFSRKERYHTGPLRRASQKATKRNPDTPARELSIPALKGLETDDSYSSELKIRQRRHTYAQPPPSGFIQNPRSRGDAQKRSMSSSRQSHLDRPNNKTSKNEEASDIRPHSSHSRLVRAVAAIRDTSDIPKWTRQPKSPSPKTGINQKMSTFRGDEGSNVPNSAIDFSHTEIEKRHSAISNGSLLSTVSSKSKGSAHPSPNSSDCSSHNNNINIYHLPHNKPQIPLRRGSLQRDLFNSGRFRL